MNKTQNSGINAPEMIMFEDDDDDDDMHSSNTYRNRTEYHSYVAAIFE